MTEHEINEKIRQACTHATPDVLDAVLSDCREQKGSVIMMTTNKKSKRWITRLAGIAACLCLIVGGVFGMRDYFINHAVDSTVSLDVNPSVEIRVNQKERVLDVIPLNSDGEIILDGMDFSGSDLNVAVNAMIGSMLQNGYLNELANSILISVDNDDPIRGTELQERLSAEVNKLLQTDKFSGSVLSQTVNRNDALKQMAEKYEITIGKAQLVQEILDEGSNHTFDELASLSINELNLLLRAEPTSKKHMDIVGTASDKAYIGEDKAKEIAIKKAGVSANNLTSYEIELDTYKGVMVYDVEFTSGNYEYDCEIDASTGNVVSFEKEYHGGPEFESNPGSNSDSNTVSTKSDSSQNGDSTLISKARAKEIALSHAGVSASNVTEFECKLDTDDGVKVYEVEFKSGNYEYDYEINASNGSIIDSEKEYCRASAAKKPTQGNNSKPGNPAAPTLISKARAKEIALSHAGVSASNVTEFECKLDTDDGVKVYEVEFKAGNYEYDYEINASNGSVIDSEKEYCRASAAKKPTQGNNSKPGNPVAPTLISKARAKEIALSHAGVSASNVTEFECKLDTDDGVKVYEVEFKAGNYEYDYEINASNGSIIDAERDRDD